MNWFFVELNPVMFIYQKKEEYKIDPEKYDGKNTQNNSFGN